MLKNGAYPDRKIYMNMIKEGSKKKVDFTYYRNNLSTKDFVKSEDNKFIITDVYDRYGIHIEITITVNENLNNIFDIKSPTTKVRGSLEHFGIVINRVSNKIPWEIHIEKKEVRCDILCQGDYGYIIGKERARIKRKMREKQEKRRNKGTRPVKISNSVSWSVSHPFQGGGISPR